ncbi:hypothetical protein ACVNIS_18015 [Sphaerotilaceae bacterium SBD11-9]
MFSTPDRILRPSPVSLATRRALDWANFVRQVHETPSFDVVREREFRHELYRDLVVPAHRELTPRLWRELEGEPALGALQERIERSTEVFRHGEDLLVAFLVVHAIKLASLTEKHWSVPLDDQHARFPACRAIAKAAAAKSVVLDPHVYNPFDLEQLSPSKLQERLVALLDCPLGAGRIPAPLVDPVVIRAVPDAGWTVIASVGVAVYSKDQPLTIRCPNEVRRLATTFFACELSVPLRQERLIAARIASWIKCQGVFGWNAGLRVSRESARRYLLGHQAWVSDSAHLMTGK